MVDDKRKKRIGEMIKHELASALLRHPEQPLFARITITSADVSPDLSMARVYFSLFDDSKIKESKAALQAAAGLLRKTLAVNLNLRVTPRLSVFYDNSVRRGQEISRLIDMAIASDDEKKREE